MSRSSARLLYWSPRILGIAFALFLGLFALDVFNGAHGGRQVALAFALHLIPAAMVATALLLAWRWEWLGAVLFSLAAAWYAWTVLPRHLNWAITLGAPLLVIAGLFLANWIARAKHRKGQGSAKPA